MKRKGLSVASVCVVLLAASAAAPSPAGAEKSKAVYTTAARLVQALDALQNGRVREAIRLYERILQDRKLPPELLARALLNRGLAHQKLGQYAAAVTDYDAALRISALPVRARVRALYNRALAFRAQGDAGRAIEDLTAALYLDPSFAPAYFARGNILHERGLYYLALADYDQALATGYGETYRVHYAKALLFSALNSLPRTKEELYAALHDKPDFAPAKKRLSAILNGTLPKNRLFADLLRRPAKRITARIAPAGEMHASVHVASVVLPETSSLNLKKTPQAEPVAPPMASKSPFQRRGPEETRSWRVASLKMAVPEKETSGKEAEAQAGGEVSGEARERKTTTDSATGHGDVSGRFPAGQRQKDEGAFSTASIAPVPAVKASAEKTPAAAYSGWAIQIASQRSKEAAEAHWRKLKPRVRQRLRSGRPVIMRAEIPGKGIYYRLRLLGFENRVSARRGCKALKRGRISCFVVRLGS